MPNYRVSEDPEVKAVIEDYVKAMQDKLPASLAVLIRTEYHSEGITVLVPFWFPITEKGRGPRKASQESNLWMKIYEWMERRNMFRSRTPQGKINEAKGLTWYINKYGTRQFREKLYKDIYTTATQEVKDRLAKDFKQKVLQIASDVVKLK